jgi:hypothetical protein
MSILYVGCIKFLTNRFVGNFVLVNVFRVFFFFFFLVCKIFLLGVKVWGFCLFFYCSLMFLF